jgi:3-phosphoglycerate kinase
MQGIKYLPRDLNIKGKRIIARLDLNVPLKDKIIQDFTRIEQVLTFLQNLIERKAKVILISHLGRPKGIRDNTLSLLPIYKYIKKKIKYKYVFLYRRN